MTRLRRGPRLVALLVTGLVVLAGCAGEGDDSATGPPVVVLRADGPVHEPVWSQSAHALLALTADGRVARIEPPGVGGTTSSSPLGDVGENLATDPLGRPVVYVPQPDRGRVVALDAGDLHPLGAFPLGPAPSYLATDEGSQVLLALSEDRSTVSAVDLEGRTAIPPQPVQAGPEAELDGPARGRPLAYHIVGPEGVVQYKGDPGEVEEQGRIDVPAGHSAGDQIKVDRLYVAERGSDRLLAVETSRDREGLEVVAADALGSPVRDVGTDETRVYAATDDALVVLEANSFIGFPGRRFERVATIPFRSMLGPALPADAADAPVSGLAVGADRVYLTLEGRPTVIAIAKPAR